MTYQRVNVILGWLLGIFATGVYVATMEPTASFWDCGEYIVTSNKLEVGHPPGAPTFMMLGRLFSMFSDTDSVAAAVNFMSGLSSGLTITFLFWIITYLTKRIVLLQKDGLSKIDEIGIFGAGFVGSLAFTFSDTFWFSAVEAEVYSMSSLFTALVFWAMLKWEQNSDHRHSNKWLILIAYLIGLSIGIHLLNLLTIPALAFIYYFKRWKETTPTGILITGIISVLLLGTVQNLIIPGIVELATGFEFFFTNTVGLPFNYGNIIFAAAIIGGIVFGLRYTHQKKLVEWNTALMAFAVLLIGYSSFGMIMVRSNANTPIDENNPENTITLLSYLNREQYGDFPLLYGQYFNSPQDPKELFKDGDPVYYQNEETGKYEVTDDRLQSIPNFHDDFKAVFPRMWSSKSNHIRQYKSWSKFKGKPKTFQNRFGQQETINKPTMGENLRYFFAYQIDWMYFRYFMWNFSGRQNDVQGHGNVTDGNWLTGIEGFDKSRLGPQTTLPPSLKNNKARNHFYLLPLILGLLGLIFQLTRDQKYTLVVFLLFFFTGIAIVIYLNQYPQQPRERDYAYVGSFFAFAIWMGLGVYALIEWLSSAINRKIATVSATLVCFLCVPVIMAKEGWDDHDRSGRYTARDIAKAYLDSCEKDAILFTNGDNDTFPLWYVQEVEEYRTDVRIVNLTLASTDWFINQMRRAAYEGKPIPMQTDPWQYRQGTRDYIRVDPRPDNQYKNSYFDVDQLVPFVTSDDPANQAVLYRGLPPENYLPSPFLQLTVPKQQLLDDKVVPASRADEMVSSIRWRIPGGIILKSELVIMDILATNDWKRPVYFANTMTQKSYFGLTNYLQHEGFAYKLVPFKSTAADRSIYGSYGTVEADSMYHRLVDKFSWGGLDEKQDITYTVPANHTVDSVSLAFAIPAAYVREANGLGPDQEVTAGQQLKLTVPVERFWDENNLRFVTNLRLSFGRLAEVLLQRGDTERAKKVLDRCWEVSVGNSTPFDIPLMNMTKMYYQMEDWDRGNVLSYRLTYEHVPALTYYRDMKKPEWRNPMNTRIRQSWYILDEIYKSIGNTKNPNQAMATEVKAEIDKIRAWAEPYVLNLLRQEAAARGAAG